MKSEALHFVTEQYLIKSQYQNNSILNFENIPSLQHLKAITWSYSWRLCA